MAFGNQFIAFRGAKRRAQIGGIFLAQTHEKGAGAGQANTVAAFAEIMGHRRDEAQATAGLGDLYVAGRAAGLVGDRQKVVFFRQACRVPLRVADTGRCGPRRFRQAALFRSG